MTFETGPGSKELSEFDAVVNPHVAEAVRILRAGLAEALRLTPREHAKRAHWAGGPSIDELERQVIEFRAQLRGGATD